MFVFFESFFPKENIISWFNGTNLKNKWFVLLCLNLAISIIILICYIINGKRIQKKNNALFYKDDNNKVKSFLGNISGSFYDEEYKCISSLQVYEYREYNDTKSACIQLKFVDGLVKENVEINAIQQTIFRLPHKIYRNVEQIKKKDNVFNSLSAQEKSSQRNDLNEKVNKVINEIYDEINKTDQDEEVKTTLARILLIYLNHNNFSVEKREELLQEGFLQNKSNKRDQILGSIVLNKLHMFYNENNESNKHGRPYFSFPYLRDKHILIVCSLDLELLDDSDNIDEICKDIFAKILGGSNDKAIGENK